MKKMKLPLKSENLPYIARHFQHKSDAVSSYYAKIIGASLADNKIIKENIFNDDAWSLGLCGKLPPYQCLNCDQIRGTSSCSRDKLVSKK